MYYDCVTSPGTYLNADWCVDHGTGTFRCMRTDTGVPSARHAGPCMRMHALQAGPFVSLRRRRHRLQQQVGVALICSPSYACCQAVHHVNHTSHAKAMQSHAYHSMAPRKVSMPGPRPERAMHGQSP